MQVIIPKAVLAEIEKPGILKAQSFLQPEVLKGQHYTVDGKVHHDGLLNHYWVKSSFGNFQVTSTSSLRILLREIEAIAAMKKIKTDDTAIESLKQSGSAEESKKAIASELFTEQVIVDILRQGRDEGIFVPLGPQLTAGVIKAMLQDGYLKRW